MNKKEEIDKSLSYVKMSEFSKSESVSAFDMLKHKEQIRRKPKLKYEFEDF